MRNAGYALVTLGFLAGSFFAVRDAEGVPIGPFSTALVAGAVGILLLRLDRRRFASDEERLTADIQSLEASLAAIAEESDKLHAEKAGIDVYDLRHRIDERFRSHLDRFVEARESIAHHYGLKAYSDVMSGFAAAERYLNRVWCASTDGYVDEAHVYIERARDQFGAALSSFRRLRE